jgi:glycosyltransferase involved in cell wall biosynthesis
MKVALALHQATLVLTVSDYARSEIIRELRVGGDKVRVAIEAPSRGYTPQMDPGTIASAAEAVGIPRGSSWFLYVGGFNPHKRVPDIVRAHAALVREGHSEAPFLVLVGEPDDGFFSESERIRDAIRAEGTTDRVIWAGFVSDECLRSLHSGSLGLLLVSHSEGFGLPAVEAAACGCPVVATTESPLPELLEGGGHFVEPGDVEGVLAAMRRLITEPSWRRRLGQTALARSRALSWDRAALALHDALHEAAR